MKGYIIILVLFTLSAHAEVYRWVDESGRIIFSDQSHPNAQKIEIKELQSYMPVAIPVIEQPAEEEKIDQIKIPDYQIFITSPSDDQVLWESSDKLVVQAQVLPELNAERGDLVQFKLDGQNVAEPQAFTAVTLTNVERGAHTISASIVDKNGTTLQSTKAISFHLHKASVRN